MADINIPGYEKEIQEALEYIKNELPDIIGTEARKHFKNNFQQEGFDGQKWAARKTKRKGSTNNQKILSKYGGLKDSINYRVDGETIVIYTDVKYAL